MTKLLKIHEAAILWGVKKRTARDWVDKRKVDIHRVGRGIRIPQSEVDRIIAEGYQPRKDAEW